jgi:hypothetical protein
VFTHSQEGYPSTFGIFSNVSSQSALLDTNI